MPDIRFTRRGTCSDCKFTGTLYELERHDCGHEADIASRGGHCEDYPACGHTDGDGCGFRQEHTSEYWANNPHLLCDHENGDCQVEDDDEGSCTGSKEDCPYGGCRDCD